MKAGAKTTGKDVDAVDKMGFMPVGQSEITLFNRPSSKSYSLFKEMKGITMVVTAQAEAEMVSDVKKQCDKHKLKHFWIDLRGANQALMTAPKVVSLLRKRLRELFTLLS